VAVPGTFTYTSAAGSLLNIANNQSEAVTFTPTDTTDYTTVPSNVIVNVLPITPTVTVTDAGGTYNGLPSTATGTATGVGGVNLASSTNPTFYYYLASSYDPKHPDAAQPLAGAPSDAGNYVAVAVFQPTGNYGEGGAITSFSITPAATATTITSSANNPAAVYGQPITYTATVTNTSGTTPAPVPVGNVQFVVDGVNYGQPVPLNAGKAVTTDSFPTGASHTVNATYIPSIPSTTDPNQGPDFKPSGPVSLNQTVQQIAVEGTALFIGSNGATSADQIQINPTGSSNTGSTGVQLQTRINSVNATNNYSQAFSSVNIYVENGSDNVQLASTLTINAEVTPAVVAVLPAGVTAGNGNDSVTLGNGSNIVTLGNGSDSVTAGSGNNTVTLGNGNDSVTAGSGNNTVTLGNGNDTTQLGDGSNVVVEGNGNDNVTAGNGNNLIVAGLGTEVGQGHDTIKVGNGNNILIAGSASVSSGHSFRDILNIWTQFPNATGLDQIRPLLTVNYNTFASTLTAGSGIDWFFCEPPTTSNKKSTDFLN
jgi:hypothetical protein